MVQVPGRVSNFFSKIYRPTLGPIKSLFTNWQRGRFSHGKPNAFSRGKLVDLYLASTIFLHDVFRVNINLFALCFVLLCCQYSFVTVFYISSKTEVHLQTSCICMRFKIIYVQIREVKPKDMSDNFMDLQILMLKLGRYLPSFIQQNLTYFPYKEAYSFIRLRTDKNNSSRKCYCHLYQYETFQFVFFYFLSFFLLLLFSYNFHFISTFNLESH